MGNSGASMEIDANKDNYQQTAEKESMKKSGNSISGNGRTICTRIISREMDETGALFFTDGSGEPCSNGI